MSSVASELTSDVVEVPAHAGLRQRKKESSRRAIEDAAWELFAEQGYEETSVNDIAERADVAPRTFFRYFPTKEAVLYPQFDELLQSLRDEFHRRPADEPVISSLFESLGTLSGSLEGGASRTQQRLAIIKRPGQQPIGTEYFRARLTLVLKDPTEAWPRLDPEGVAVSRRYNEMDLAVCVRRFVEERRKSVAWLRSLQNPDWSLAYVHPRFGATHAGDLLASWQAHDALHLRQIAKRMFELAGRDAPGFRTEYAGEWRA